MFLLVNFIISKKILQYRLSRKQSTDSRELRGIQESVEETGRKGTGYRKEVRLEQLN